MKAVPEAYHGVWQRTLLRLSDGTEDTTTRVFWLQSAHLHADLRIPDPAPKLSCLWSAPKYSSVQCLY